METFRARVRSRDVSRGHFRCGRVGRRRRVLMFNLTLLLLVLLLLALVRMALLGRAGQL